MDAVQEANSGHPGTPMAMAPVVYTLWQHFLRFDPADPIWPNRDRFVLSAGHASMLLYSLLHLTGVKAVDAEYERLGEPVGPARRDQALPPARQQVPGPSGIPLDLGRRDHDRAARPGRGQQRRHGDRRPTGWPQHFNRPGFEIFDLQRLRPVRRRLHDGGRLQRGGLARRPSGALATSAGSTTTTTSRSRATPRWPSARMSPRASSAMAGTSLRVGDANDRERIADAIADCQAHRRPADPDHRRQPHRLRRAAQAGHQRPPTASRWARKRSGVTKRSYGWPEDAKFLVPDGRLRAFRRAFGARGKELRDDWMALFDALPRRVPRPGRRARPRCSAASCPRAGTRTSRPSRPTPRASPAATRRARC